MSPSILKPVNFPTELAMYMDVAGIGTVPAGLKDGHVVFGPPGSDPAKLPKIIEVKPDRECARLAEIVRMGSAKGPSSDIGRFMEEVRAVQGVADRTVRRDDRKGNFRREAERSYEEARALMALPQEATDWQAAAATFLQSALLYTKFHRFEDLIRSKELFMSAGIAFANMGRQTAAAICDELAAEMITPFRELTPVRNELRAMAAGSWLRSLDEYFEPDSVRFRLLRALVHLTTASDKKMRQQLITALAAQDFEDGSFLEFHSNNIRLAYAISNDDEVRAYEWRTVAESLKGAALAWEGLEGVEFDIAEPLMRLAGAAESFSQGGTQFIM